MRAHSSYFRRKNSKKGLALSTAMAICIVLSILVALLVSMATLNITTTQVTVNQREAYIQAKSALSYAESYYSQNGESIPGAGNVGEGLIVFKTDNVADGADFYESKSGTTVLIEDSTLEKYKKDCADTYVIVKNSMTSTGESLLTMTAVSKYGKDDAYSLTKEFTIGGHSNIQDNAFTGSINYQTTNQTRYVRFHVRATTALGGAPYFYMWYNQISPPYGKDGYNQYATSSIENKLTFNRYYGTVQNGSWNASGPEGACAMSYEGNGWYVTQKTFNLNRNVHFVNGIITKTGASRDKGDDQQSWEFFGIPLPEEDELGASNGIDVYFELNKNELKDMKENNDWDDQFTAKYRSYAHSGDKGHTQLTNFVKFCSEYYTVYTKTDTAIMHYRKAGVTTNTPAVSDFTYEGYGWWRRTTHNFGDTSFGYSYGNGAVISQNQYGKERIIESFVVEDAKGNTAQFSTEEEANQWLIKHDDLSAGNYIEVNVKSATQPVDPTDNPGARLSYEAMIYTGTEPVPNYSTAKFDDVAGTDSDVKDTDLSSLDDPEFKEIADLTYGGDFFIVGNMNDWGNNYTWSTLDRQLQSDNNAQTYSIEMDVNPGEELQFWVVQKPSNVYKRVVKQSMFGGQSYSYVKLVDDNPNFTRYTGESNLYYAGSDNYAYSIYSGYTNWWGQNGTVNNAYTVTPATNRVKITFAYKGNTISVDDIGLGGGEGSDTDTDITISATKTYSVIGWMNNWGTNQDNTQTTDGTAIYALTRDMQMYSDVDGVLTYSDGTLIVESGKEYKFKIAERDAGVSVNDPVDWTRVYNADGSPASTAADVAAGDDGNAKLIQPPMGSDGKPVKYYVTITYGPDPKDGKIKPDYLLTPFDDVDTYYVIGEFNGWDSNEPIKSSYETKQAASYQMTQSNTTKNDIEFTYKINTVKEAGHYELMVIGSHSTRTEDGKVLIDYTKAWGKKDDENLTEDGAKITMGSAPFEYDLAERSQVLITFTYHKNDPTTSEITITPIPLEDSDVERVHVGFHNAQLKNVNDSGKDSKFTTPWENVYITYYTEETGFNCFLARKADGGKNWWADVPVDAEYVYFSNKRTNVYNELHSGSAFEYTVDIKNEEFAGSDSTIFYPIIPETDDEERTRWTVGDSQDYFEYVNHRQKVSETNAQMAYYGSTQCNYYDAPFVNVLNMLLTGDPKPTTKYAYSSVAWSDFEIRKSGGRHLYFNKNNKITYQGETYYYTDISSWYKDSSFMLINNPNGTKHNENGAYMYAYLFEDQLSLETNGDSNKMFGTYVTNWYQARKDGAYYWASNSNMYQYLYMDNRAGGVFVSDPQYRDGSSSPFNYGGYTPSWFTYRIPVSNDITISDVSIVTSKGTYTSLVSGNTHSFTPVRESTNVNRPVYYYLTGDNKTQTYTYNINQGVVDGLTNAAGVTNVSVYFDNCDDEKWTDVSVHAIDLMGNETYESVPDDNTTKDNNYKVFTFEEGAYTFFQFYDGPATADGLKNATKKSSVMYLTGEELGMTSDANNDNYSGLDSRTTKILCQGSATGFTWYMHPRTQIMRAYLDMDTVTQMTTNTKYYSYDQTQGVYHCYDTVTMSSFASKRTTLKQWYDNGNVAGSSGVWTAKNLETYGDGLLEAAAEFMDAADEAKIYISEDVKDAPKGATAWFGNDKDNMVFLEGEQIQDSAFEYTSRWTNGLKNVYKSIMLESYHKTDENGVQSNAVTMNGNCVYTNASKQTAAQFRQYAADLRLWLDNPQATIKKDAVRILIDDSKKKIGKVTTGGWGKEAIHLYVKDPITGWQVFSSDICTTTQANFYAYVFMLPSDDAYYNQEFMIAPSMPVSVSQEVTLEGGGKTTITKDYVDGVEIKTQRITSGNQYRFNTCYSLDDPKCFSIDTSVETKTYSGTEITKGDNSPTSNLNQFIGMTVGKKFVINFKYDTDITYNGTSYKIFAGAYTIDEKYPGFYADFGATSKDTATKSGIDLYTDNARKFFTERNSEGYMNYGMKSATGYSDWATNKVNSGKDLDVMTSRITKSGDVVASENNNRVNFRWITEKAKDTMKVDRNVTLKGTTVTIAANVIDFRSAGSADFTVDSGTIEFLTDTEIKKADGTTAVISHGTYVINSKVTDKKSIKVSLKSTSDPETDWRSKFALVSDIGSELEGGRYVETYSK